PFRLRSGGTAPIEMISGAEIASEVTDSARLQQTGDGVDQGRSEQDLQRDAADTDDERDDHDGDVLEQYREREQDDAERRECVEARERRSEKSRRRATHDEDAEDEVAQPVAE